MSKYTEKSKEYTMQYMKDNLDEIRFRVKKTDGGKEKYKTAADKAGVSMAQFFITAADEKIERDGLALSEQEKTAANAEE